MSANWNLGEQFLGGASLAARIAGQIGNQKMDRERLDNDETSSIADSVARTGYTPEELGDPASGAGAAIQKRVADAAAGKIALEKAQTDYFSGRNAAYSGAAAARAAAMAAKTAQSGANGLQAELKKYDDMAMVDPDGTKGIYTSDAALRHAALWNQFSLKNNIATGGKPGAPPAPAGAVVKQGTWDSITSGIGSLASRLVGGEPPIPAAAPGVRIKKGSDGNFYQFDANNKYIGPAPVGGK